MKTVTISSRFQVLIPRKVRESLGLIPGTKLLILDYDDRLEIIPLRDQKSLRGFLKGIETDVPRDEG